MDVPVSTDDEAHSHALAAADMRKERIGRGKSLRRANLLAGRLPTGVRHVGKLGIAQQVSDNLAVTLIQRRRMGFGSGYCKSRARDQQK